MTLPVRNFSEGGTSYVVRVEPDASNVIDAFASGVEMTTDAEARIQVQNGNGVSGSAATVGTQLSSAGFDVVGSIDSARSDYAVTQIVSGASNLALAQAVRDALGYGEVILGRTPADVEIVVILGADVPPG